MPAMRRSNAYYVYILTNPSRTFSVGVTNDLERRVWEHKQLTTPGFAKQHHITQLVYFEESPRIEDAIAREKQLKDWRRAKKITLIESVNPRWRDLSAGWYDG